MGCYRTFEGGLGRSWGLLGWVQAEKGLGMPKGRLCASAKTPTDEELGRLEGPTFSVRRTWTEVTRANCVNIVDPLWFKHGIKHKEDKNYSQRCGSGQDRAYAAKRTLAVPASPI